MAAANPLVSSEKSAGDQLQCVLHPLVLLNISDYITRHTLRRMEGPVVGALIGQQNAREITIEHAFDVLLETNADGDIILKQPWFSQRLEQMKLVHRDRQLEFVGLWALLPRTGPTPKILPLHTTTLETINEASVLLAFHPDEVAEPSVGGKLPLTIYEYVDEASDSASAQKQTGDEDSEMTDGGDDTAASKSSGLTKKFRELPYTVETGEAEMISIDFVAKGAANATAAAPAEEKKKENKPTATKAGAASSSKGKAPEASKPTTSDTMAREDEELVATLTAKANAIKMLQSRIQLITKYLESLPSSENPTTNPSITPSPTILRQIQALVHRLPLLAPPSAVDSLWQELLAESNDVHLVSLMNDVVQSLSEARDLGRKFAIVEQARNQRSKGGSGGDPFGGGMSGMGVMGASKDIDDLLKMGRPKGQWLPG